MAGNKRVIHGAEDESVGSLRQAANRGLNGRKLPLSPVRILNRVAGIVPQLAANFFGSRTKHNSSETDSRVPGDLDQMFDESFAAIGKKPFRRAHAAGFTAR